MSCTKARSANGNQDGRRIRRLYRDAAEANRSRHGSIFEAHNQTDKSYRKIPVLEVYIVRNVYISFVPFLIFAMQSTFKSSNPKIIC